MRLSHFRIDEWISGRPSNPVTRDGVYMAIELRELRDAAERAVSIADEAFGLGPVEPIDATLTRIEAGIFAARLRERELEAEVQRLLCYTVGEYVDGEMEPAHLAQFEAHLAKCERCQHEVAELTAVTTRLRGMERADG